MSAYDSYTPGASWRRRFLLNARSITGVRPGLTLSVPSGLVLVAYTERTMFVLKTLIASAVLAAGAVVPVSNASAQTVAGGVRDTATDQDIAGAVVSALDSTGKP